jgi:diamine N-acetyltransferase
MAVTLQPITDANVAAVCALKVAPHQASFVATNLWSLAQAYAAYAIAWPRAIVAAEEPVGFLMLEIDPDEKDGRPFWLWRLMIDERHQRKGYGRQAIALVIEELRPRGAQALYTSWVPGDGTPGPFYRGLGFEPTGEVDDGEIVARLELA